MNEIAKTKSCPSCGSKRIEELFEDRNLSIPLAPVATYRALVDHCLDCERRGDFLRANTKTIEAAIDLAKKQSMSFIINELSKDGDYSMAAMERVLGLPQRTMMRWKTGTFSDSAMTLVRFLATYPWLLDVADAKYDSNYAQERLAVEGIHATARMAELQNITEGITAYMNPETHRTTGIFTSANAATITNEKADYLVIA